MKQKERGRRRSLRAEKQENLPLFSFGLKETAQMTATQAMLHMDFFFKIQNSKNNNSNSQKGLFAMKYVLLMNYIYPHLLSEGFP